MTRDELLQFLRAQPWAVEASVSGRGEPQAAVIGVAVTDRLELVFDTLATSRKAANLRANPRIALVLGWDDGQTVQIEGVADEPVGAEVEAAKETYLRRFPDGHERAGLPDITYFRIVPSWIRYSDFRTTPPTIVVFEGDLEPPSVERGAAVSPPCSVLQLAEQLRALGVGANDIVMIHASMRRVGAVAGGAASVIDALRDAVGPGGTLLMVLSADEEEPFDALRSPVDVEDMGILAEVFRNYPGVSVNDHPADRFAALGPLASSLLEPTPLHDYHGPGSVLERLTERGGKVLRLGANTDTVTLTHYAEYLADVPNKVRARRRYVRSDTGEVWIESLDDTDGIAIWEEGDYFPQIFLDYRASGGVRIGPVGRCEAELFDAAPFVKFAVDWMNVHLAPNRLSTGAPSPDRGLIDAELVAEFFRQWRALGLRIWLDGGFCVEALVGRTLRPHSDLDVAVEHSDFGRFAAWCETAGFASEPSDSADIVVFARKGVRLDAHIVEHGADGAYVSGVAYPNGSLTGEATIAGERVSCIAPEWLLRFKTSYAPQEKDRIDVRALCDRFGWPIPLGYS